MYAKIVEKMAKPLSITCEKNDLSIRLGIIPFDDPPPAALSIEDDVINRLSSFALFELRR